MKKKRRICFWEKHQLDYRILKFSWRSIAKQFFLFSLSIRLSFYMHSYGNRLYLSPCLFCRPRSGTLTNYYEQLQQWGWGVKWKWGKSASTPQTLRYSRLGKCKSKPTLPKPTPPFFSCSNAINESQPIYVHASQPTLRELRMRFFNYKSVNRYYCKTLLNLLLKDRFRQITIGFVASVTFR